VIPDRAPEFTQRPQRSTEEEEKKRGLRISVRTLSFSVASHALCDLCENSGTEAVRYRKPSRIAQVFPNRERWFSAAERVLNGKGDL